MSNKEKCWWVCPRVWARGRERSVVGSGWGREEHNISFLVVARAAARLRHGAAPPAAPNRPTSNALAVILQYGFVILYYNTTPTVSHVRKFWDTAVSLWTAILTLHWRRMLSQKWSSVELNNCVLIYSHTCYNHVHITHTHTSQHHTITPHHTSHTTPHIYLHSHFYICCYNTNAKKPSGNKIN